ncbi:MAG TPA: tetratricopeptide repeat protein [Candidatus Acidoferrales bacterium]|nr:tetratricopeptide repeat protein [Candidatus Acidoferrales bacterium]
MFSGLSYLFFPWGFILQALALIHALRRRPDTYWYWIILIGGALGALAYIVVEVVPDTRLLGDFFKGFQQRSRIEQLEAAVLDNPSSGNYEELADLLLDQKKYARARNCYDKAIAAKANSVDAFYRRALCSLALGDTARALPDLEFVVNHEARYDHDRAAGLLAHVYAQLGHTDQANALFARVTEISNFPEVHYNYAQFLKSQGRASEAREAAERILQRKRTMPRYLQRIERPWFRRAKALLREVPQA